MMELKTGRGNISIDDFGNTKVSGQIRDDIVKVNGKLPENVSVAEDKNNDKDNHGA